MSPLPGEVRKIPARKSVLSSQLALLDRFFLNDDLQMRGHIPVQPNRDGELAQRLERFVELDLTTIQIEAFLRERFGNITGRHRSEAPNVLSRAPLKCHSDSNEPLGPPF